MVYSTKIRLTHIFIQVDYYIISNSIDISPARSMSYALTQNIIQSYLKSLNDIKKSVKTLLASINTYMRKSSRQN